MVDFYYQYRPHFFNCSVNPVIVIIACYFIIAVNCYVSFIIPFLQLWSIVNGNCSAQL